MPLKSAYISLALVTAILSSQVAPASQDSPYSAQIPQAEDVSPKTHFSVQTGLSLITSRTGSILGLDAAVGVEHALNDVWGLSAQFMQTTQLFTFQNAAIAFSGGVMKAVKGRLYRNVERTLIDGQEVTRSETLPEEAIVINFHLKQTFFNGSQTAIPLSGFSLFATYAFPSSKSIVLRPGVGIDLLGSISSTNSLILFPIRIFINVSF